MTPQELDPPDTTPAPESTMESLDEADIATPRRVAAAAAAVEAAGTEAEATSGSRPLVPVGPIGGVPATRLPPGSERPPIASGGIQMASIISVGSHEPLERLPRAADPSLAFARPSSRPPSPDAHAAGGDAARVEPPPVTLRSSHPPAVTEVEGAAIDVELDPVSVPPSQRMSDPPPEVDVADVVLTAPHATPPPPPVGRPAARPPSNRPPPAPAGAHEGASHPPSSPPVVEDPAIVRPPDEAVTKRRPLPWWEDIFSEDFVRSHGRITDAQVEREVAFIEESLAVQRGGVLLDLGCGMGRHAIALSRRGYQVVGYDLSLAMLARASELAQQAQQKLNFLQGDMREMGFEDMFDGIYCWSTSFGYFDEEKNATVAARMHRALRRGGTLLLDVVNRDYVTPRQPNLVWFEVDSCICIDETTVDAITSRLRVKRTAMLEQGRTREVEYTVRLYSLHELGRLLHDTGFKVTEVSGQPATPGVFFGADSPRIIILAEKV